MKEQRGSRAGTAKSTERRLLIGFLWPNYAAELKILLIALLLLCSLATFLRFLPPSLSLSPSACYTSRDDYTESESNSTGFPPPVHKDEVLENRTVKRSFQPVGTAAYSFILMSAYRGGAATFSVIGLASKPLHLFGHPTYTCEYESAAENATVPGRTILPDWGFGRVYTTVVINCTFPVPVAIGGRLLVHAASNGGFDSELSLVDTVEALIESPDSLSLHLLDEPPMYEYLYCGSPLYGNLSPQRIREWMAYHVRLFGSRSHFVIYDAGGVHPEVLEVLKPWIELGYVSLQDIREQERFDAYYHNQFLVVNDCLHRYRFSTKWMFFFDVDEFIYVKPENSLSSVMDSFVNFTQITIPQIPISGKLCRKEDADISSTNWGLEKLVYRDAKKVARRDRKYAVQPRNVLATGVHLSQHIVGSTNRVTEMSMSYLHYHGTIAQRKDPCRLFVNETYVKVDGNPYVAHTILRSLAPLVKQFELEAIGSRLQRTRQ